MCHDVSVQIHAMGFQQQSTTHSNILLIKTNIKKKQLCNEYLLSRREHDFMLLDL